MIRGLLDPPVPADPQEGPDQQDPMDPQGQVVRQGMMGQQAQQGHPVQVDLPVRRVQQAIRDPVVLPDQQGAQVPQAHKVLLVQPEGQDPQDRKV